MMKWHHLFLLACSPMISKPSLVIVANASDSRSIDDESSPFPSLNLTSSEKLLLQRLHESRFGVKRLLVVRVSSSKNEVPMESLDEIEGAVYGTGPNPMRVPANASLVAQFRAVSHSRLLYEPVIVPNLSRPGLLDIVIDESTTNADISSTTTRFDAIVRPAMMNEVTRILGESIFTITDRVLFCMPSGSLDQSIAGVGEVGGMFTFYHLGYCRKLDALMHELGHNLNFHHSGIGAQEYGDMSDYMGGLEAVKSPKKTKRGFLKKSHDTEISPIDGAGYPRKAFNGHKHWNSGWFQDRAFEVFPSASSGIIQRRIVSFVEYSNPNMLHDDLVLLKCGTLYIQYNRVKDYNVDASEANRVTISEGFVDGGISKRVASLDRGESYRFPNFDKSGMSLVVQVCKVTEELPGFIDYAEVKVYLDDGTIPMICPTEAGSNEGHFWDPTRFLSTIINVQEPFRSVFSTFVFSFVIFMGCAASCLCCFCICHWNAVRQAGNKNMKSSSIDSDVDETVIDMEVIPL